MRKVGMRPEMRMSHGDPDPNPDPNPDPWLSRSEILYPIRAMPPGFRAAAEV